MDRKLLGIVLGFCFLHTLFWFSANYQLVEGVSQKKALALSIFLSVPTTLLVFYVTRYAYDTIKSVWAIKFIGFSSGYIVFPILTWIFLHESPFTYKTVSCLILAFIIVMIQLHVPNN